MSDDNDICEPKKGHVVLAAIVLFCCIFGWIAIMNLAGC